MVCLVWLYNVHKTAQRTTIYLAVVYLEHFVFLSTWLVRWTWPKWYITTGQENGKIGNTSCLIGNLIILGYMNMLLKVIS